MSDVPGVGPHVRLPVPEGWEQVGDGTGARSVRPAGAGVGAPAVSVVVAERSATSPVAYALAVVAGLGRALSDMVLVSEDVDADEVAVVVAHEMLGVDVTTVQRHLLGPDGATVVVAATVADPLWPLWQPSLSRLLAAAEVDW